MSAAQEEALGLSSGLPLDNTDGVIIGFEFGYNAAIGAGVVCANIKVLTENGDEAEQSFSVGDGWEIAGKGASIASDQPRRLSKRSNWGRLVDSMVAALGGAEAALTTMPDLNFRHAACWIGTKWHWGTTKVASKNMQTGVEKEKDAIIVTKFIGKDGELAQATAAAAPTTKAAGKKGKPGLADTDAELFGTLVKLAASHEDHDSFMAAALELDTVDGNAAAMNAVMSTKPGSAWAAAQAG